MNRIILGVLAVALFAFSVESAFADELSSSNVMNDVLDRFHDATSTWGPAIKSAATRLFWTLVVISMVWTFGQMALRKADIGEFFAEFVRFILFTGFFWWLLDNANNGMNIAGTIVKSLQNLGAEAGGLSSNNLGPSSILDLGFELYDKTVQATKELGWRKLATALTMELLAIAILIVLALIAINLLLVTASAWILLYAGVFFLGFGGSRWTSDMAINYYKTVLGIAAQLMAMILLVAIGRQFIDHYYGQISEVMASQELAVMLVIALILLFLVNKVPAMISGIVTGASLGAIGSAGSFGAGAAAGAAMTAARLATRGAALASKAMLGAAGVGSAITAAFQKAAGSASNSSESSSFSSTSGSKGASSSNSGSSPFAQAAGFSNSSDNSITESGSKESSKEESSSEESSTESNNNDNKADEKKSGSSNQGSAITRAAQVTASTGAALAKGIGSVAMAKVADVIANTTGGKIAAAIKASGGAAPGATAASGNAGGGEFSGNSLGGGGWINQTGGFSALSPAEQAVATASHAAWQEQSEGNTFGVEDYVSYVQERQQERNEEISSFANKKA